jgi:hypothetical protein
MLDSAHEPYLLEINTMPGFTPTSLLPEAAAHAGIGFGQLVDRLVRRAHARGVHRASEMFVTGARVSLPRLPSIHRPQRAIRKSA